MAEFFFGSRFRVQDCRAKKNGSAWRRSMAQATTISLSKFTGAVQAAVKAAVAKHPKFKVDPPHAISVSYLIRGIPIPEAILANVSVGETQAFADDIVAHVAGAHPEAVAAVGRGPGGGGAVFSAGGHCIVGIPPASQMIQVEK
jgi:hypothetical protein